MSQEYRLTARLTQHWDMIRKDKELPDIHHLRPDVIDDLWQQCVMIGINVGTQENTSYKYEYMAPGLAEAYGRDMTGTQVDVRMKQFPGSVLTSKLKDVIANKKPAEDQGAFVNEQGKTVKYRASFLPFGNDSKGLTHVVVGLSYRLF